MEEKQGILPEMLYGEKLTERMEILPPYSESIRNRPAPERLAGLENLLNIYITSPMSAEIYSRVYLSVLRSVRKKRTAFAVRQRYENAALIKGQPGRGILGGADSFSIIGTSGIGKSSAISRAVELITAPGPPPAADQRPESGMIPCVTVQCPFDASVKGLLLEILRQTDAALGTAYYKRAVRARATVDMLIGSVSQTAISHICLLVVDEIQNVTRNRGGVQLTAALTQLINSSGISIALVGTPECTDFLEREMHLARRSVGLQYGPVPYDAWFEEFCAALFSYQYVRRPAVLTPALLQWLYDHSGGIVSVVVSLLYEAQETAIMDGTETLDAASLGKAWQKRLQMLHPYIRAARIQEKRWSEKTPEIPGEIPGEMPGKIPGETPGKAPQIPHEAPRVLDESISAMVQRTKRDGLGTETLLSRMRRKFPVEEVCVAGVRL